MDAEAGAMFPILKKKTMCSAHSKPEISCASKNKKDKN
jgi:hypothetical protein